MRVRRARSGDRGAFASFCCSDGTPRQTDIERWVRRKALNWQKSSLGNELYVLVDEAEDIVGLYAFRPGGEEDEWFIVAVAVATAHQNQGIGRRLLETCVDRLQQRAPGGWAYWNVDRGNVQSHAVSQHVGDVDPFPDSAKLTSYTVRL